MQEGERGPRMYAAKNAGSAAAFRAQESLAGLQSMPLAERAAAEPYIGRQKTSRQDREIMIAHLTHVEDALS